MLQATEDRKTGAAARPLRIGVCGLGVAASQIYPAFRDGAPYSVGAGADNRKEARDAFQQRFDVPTFDSVDSLCRSGLVDAVWIATPNTLHAEHAVAAARQGCHVICEKPMAVTLAECDRMIRAAETNKVKLLQGHSKIYQAPMRAMRDVIKSGRLGRVVQIHALNSNDWLQRPRLAPELDTSKGGGLVYRQGPHLVDIVRFLGGGMVANVRGLSGRADRNFDTEGHFSALLEFDHGAVATLTFNGYGWFDVTELTWSIGESGFPQTKERSFPGTKPRLTGPANTEEKAGVAHDRARERASDKKQPFFGLTLVTCEKGAIRQSPDGLYVYSEGGREEILCDKSGGRDLELRELASGIADKRPVFPDGSWGKATLEVCLAIMASGRDGRVRRLRHQVPAP